MIEHAVGHATAAAPRLSEAALAAIGEVWSRGTITGKEIERIAAAHGMRIRSLTGTATAQLLQLAREVHTRDKGRSRASGVSPKEFRRRRTMIDAEADAYAARNRHLRRNPPPKFRPPSPLALDALKKTRPMFGGSREQQGRYFDEMTRPGGWVDQYVDACRVRR